MVAKWAEIERRNQSREGGRAIKGGDVASDDGDDGGGAGDVVRGRKMVLF